MKRTPASRENSQLLTIVVAVVVIATLYFARDVFVPLALAWLLSLVLTPVIVFMERVKMPRVLAVFLVVISLTGTLGLLGWKTSLQFIDFTNQISTYRKTLQDKIHQLKGPPSQSLNKATDTMKELGKEMAAGTVNDTPKDTKKALPGSSQSQPMAVEVVPPSNPLESAQSVLGPVATAGIVIIFTIFMLMDREDLRNRFIRLAGGARLNAMTQALDDATHRINRYLLLQSLVNACYGIFIGGALYFIGLPNAALWGVIAFIFRFLPYIGPPSAALMPILLSLAIFPGWHHAFLTLAVFVVLELTVANFVEPLLYGAHVGLSGLAILVAAVFWTLLWGFPGLVLSTPLTVCLVVVGRYVPNLAFLSIMLGDEPVMPPHAQYYQRLLAADQVEAKKILEQYLKDKPLEDLYSSVVIPALSLAEQDRHRNELDEETQTFIYQSTREMIEELGINADQPPPGPGDGADSADSTPGIAREDAARLHVLCLPARDDADDVVALLLCQMLERQGYKSQALQIASSSEMLAHVTAASPSVVCISALPPFAVEHARSLYKRLRMDAPDVHIVICLWHFEGDIQKAAIRLALKPEDILLTTVPQVLHHLSLHTQTPVPPEKIAT